VALVGNKRAVGDMGQTDLVAAANKLFPTQSQATKNRWVIKPGAAILHHAARQKLCGWERVENAEVQPDVGASPARTSLAMGKSTVMVARYLAPFRNPGTLVLPPVSLLSVRTISPMQE
jgi:hypothetical protein